MKFEVIGWTNFHDETYPEHEGDYAAVDRAVEQAIRAGGYKFDAGTHQHHPAGTPVLNDGTRACYSMREWGSIMADALDLPDDDGMAYLEWYVDEEDLYLEESHAVLPPEGVDKSRIVPREALSETFEMHLIPAAFDAVASGKKTVEIRLLDDKRELICEGDFIVFSCDTQRVRVRVLKVETLDGFGCLVDPQGRYESYETYVERRELTERALFPGCETPKALYDLLNTIYPPERRKWSYALAFFIERVKEDI